MSKTWEEYLENLKTYPYFAAGSRTGSSHIARCTGRIMGLPVQSPRWIHAGRFSTDDHQIDHTLMGACKHLGLFVLHQHSKGTGNNVAILKAFGIKPMVIIRNMFDSLVSVKEQMEITDNMTCPGVPRPEYYELTEGQKWDWISFNLIPWYFQFYASWHYATQIDRMMIHYRDFYSENNFKVVSKILDWVGYPNPGEEVVAATHARKDARFNVGISGRGKAVPEIVKERAYLQAKSWGPLEKHLIEDYLEH
jgi:hypothetical protein